MKTRGEDNTGVYFFRMATLEELRGLAENAGRGRVPAGGAGKKTELLQASTRVTIIENDTNFY